jgi:hypothetical protein
MMTIAVIAIAIITTITIAARAMPMMSAVGTRRRAGAVIQLFTVTSGFGAEARARTEVSDVRMCGIDGVPTEHGI